MESKENLNCLKWMTMLSFTSTYFFSPRILYTYVSKGCDLVSIFEVSEALTTTIFFTEK